MLPAGVLVIALGVGVAELATDMLLLPGPLDIPACLLPVGADLDGVC